MFLDNVYTKEVRMNQAVKNPLKKLKIISELGGFMAPDEGMELEQRLTITANGRVWFSSYGFSIDSFEYIPLFKRQFSINPATAQEILSKVAEYFTEEQIDIYATDAGRWGLELTFSDNAKQRFTGSLIEDKGKSKLSRNIRKKLDMNELFLFDGATEN